MRLKWHVLRTVGRKPPSCREKGTSSPRSVGTAPPPRGYGQAGAPLCSPNMRGVTFMSKKAAEHHTKAQEHHTSAAHHHGEAAKHHSGGQHEKAAHHAHTAAGHAHHARHHSEE